MAVVLALSTDTEIDSSKGRSRGPAIETLFLGPTRDIERLGRAAREVVKSAVFRRTATGYEFAERHVHEWFAAFGLARVPLVKLRPLIVDERKKPFSHLRGLCGILAQITSCEDIQAWIAELYGGIAPRSDAAPWTLGEAVAALDRLQEFARTSIHGLSARWDYPLGDLAAPGLGAELAKRLETQALTHAEENLLIDVARQTDAKEAAPVAERIVRDFERRVELRKSAAFLLKSVGEDGRLQALGPFIRAFVPSTREERALKSALIFALYSRKVWTYDEAVLHCPDATPCIGDSTSLLWSRLERDMTLDNARSLLRHTAHNCATPRRYLPHRSRGDIFSLIDRAVDLVVKQRQHSMSDYELLIPQVLAMHESGVSDDRHAALMQAFSSIPEARRALFEAGVDDDTAGRPRWARSWCWVLQSDDLEWLGGFAESRPSASSWLWERLLALAYAPGVSRVARLPARKLVKSHSDAALKAFDNGRRKYLSHEKRFQELHAATERRQRINHVRLEDKVREALDRVGVSLRQRLHVIAWLCFEEESYRPTSVVGKWDGLPEGLRCEVIEFCEVALQKSRPTRIPRDATIPAGIVHEGAAFEKVLSLSRSYTLNGREIRKWLPAKLLFSIPDYTEVLKRCIAADAVATERVVARSIRRELAGNAEVWPLMHNLPIECWSDRLAQECVKLVGDRGLGIEGRCCLLKVLATVAPSIAEKIATAWVKTLNGETSQEAKRRLTAIDVLLTTNPDGGMAFLLEEVDRRGADVLRNIDAVAGWRDGSAAVIANWSPRGLEQLYRLIHMMNLPEEDDEPTPRHVSYTELREDQLRRVRSAIPAILFQRSTPEDTAALDRLAAEFKGVTEWYAWARSNAGATELLAAVAAAPPEKRGSEGIPARNIVRVLDDAAYRLVRSSEDLQQVLLEELEEISKTAKQHLSMLYRPIEQKGSHPVSVVSFRPGEACLTLRAKYRGSWKP